MGPYASVYHAEKSRQRFASVQKQAEQAQQAEKELMHCLKTVPEVYFRPDFSIQDKKFFSDLSERKDKMVLQDKLSYYLDLVEVNLLKQICLRANSVLTALQIIQKLHADVAAACMQIKSIRENISRLHTHLVTSVVHVLRSKRRGVNTQVLKEKMELIATVAAAQSTVKTLISTSDYANALNLISSTKEILKRDLEGVNCVKNMEQKLNQQAILIEKFVTSGFVHMAIGDSSSKSVSVKLDEETHAQMSQLAANALKMGKMAHLVTSLGAAVNKCVKQTIKEFIDDFLTKVEHAQQNGFAKEIDEKKEDSKAEMNRKDDNSSRKEKIKNLEHRKFVTLLQTFFPHMMRFVRRLSNVEGTLTNGASLLQSTGNTIEKTEGEDYASDLKSALKQYKALLSSTCEFVHGRASNLLLTRKNISLGLNELKDMSATTNVFISDSEKLCNKTFYGLRGTLKDRTKDFLKTFHEKNVLSLVASLESELWRQADVPREFQDLIDSGFRRRMTSKKESKVSRVIFFQVPGQNGTRSGFLKFALVSSTLILLKMISRYIECAAHLKVLISDILIKLKKLLLLFNSKSCGLVLGAGAIQLAGLKNINVTHLALASQSLGLIISQIPVIRSALLAHLPPKHHVLLEEFNSVSADFKEHQREIFKKFVQIIDQLTEAAMRNLSDAKWAQGGDKPIFEVEKGIMKLLRQTSSMHNKLSSLIDQQQRDSIFRQIAAVFSRVTKKHIGPIWAKGDAGVKKKLSIQVQHILSRLRSLSGIDKSACKELESFKV